MRTLILLCLFSSCYCLFGVGRERTVGVVGKLICLGKPAAGVKVTLYEKGFYIDRKLAQVNTDYSGSFKIQGTATGFYKNDLQLKIYHRCNYKGPCYKYISATIPPNYISKGKQVLHYWDLVRNELSVEFIGEEKQIECNI